MQRPTIGGGLVRAILALALLSTQAAAEQVTIRDDYGGVVVDYLKRLDTWEREKKRLVIEGVCESACTLYLSSPNTCVKRTARLGFHAPRGGETNEIDAAAAAYMLNSYPPKVRAWVKKHGGLQNDGLVYLEGADMVRRVKMCR